MVSSYEVLFMVDSGIEHVAEKVLVALRYLNIIQEK